MTASKGVKRKAIHMDAFRPLGGYLEVHRSRSSDRRPSFSCCSQNLVLELETRTRHQRIRTKNIPYCSTENVLHHRWTHTLCNVFKMIAMDPSIDVVVLLLPQGEYSVFKKELDRQEQIKTLLMFYLKRSTPTRKVEEGLNVEVDGLLSHGNRGFPVYAILEVENELGLTSADKLFKGQNYYARFCISNQNSGAYKRSNCPAFLLEFRGPHMRISAMVYFDRVHTSFITDMVNLCDPTTNLVAIFRALCRALDGLELFYKTIPEEVGGYWMGVLEEESPYPLWLSPKYSFKNRFCKTKLLFLAEDANGQKVLIKFCKRYGKEVNKAWHEVGFAPELLDFQELGGDFKMVVMEFLGPPWEMLHNLDVVDKEEARVVALEALNKVHGLRVFDSSNPGSVHRDAWDVNVLVRRDGGDVEVKFVDFDWVGQESVCSYPQNMNHVDLVWPEGVADGMPMLQIHDVDFLSNQTRPSTYDWKFE